MYTEYEYLSHSGIKGMKWGIRRYRNEDGTLTEAGKKRYAKLVKYSDAAYDAGLREKHEGIKQLNARFSKVLSPSRIKKITDECSSIAIKSQEKIRNIDKKEIEKGLDFYEHKVAKSAIKGFIIGSSAAGGTLVATPIPKIMIPHFSIMAGIVGANVGMAISSIKNRKSAKERSDVEDEYLKEIAKVYSKALTKAYGNQLKKMSKLNKNDIRNIQNAGNSGTEANLRMIQQQQLAMQQNQLWIQQQQQLAIQQQQQLAIQQHMTAHMQMMDMHMQATNMHNHGMGF